MELVFNSHALSCVQKHVALHILDLGTRSRWGVCFMLWSLSPQGKPSCTHRTGDWWAQHHSAFCILPLPRNKPHLSSPHFAEVTQIICVCAKEQE